MNNKKLPGAPSVAQPKAAGRGPVAPPVYRPQPTPRVLQTKQVHAPKPFPAIKSPATVQRSTAGVNSRALLPPAPPRHPVSVRAIQPKPLTVAAPPVFRPMRSMPSSAPAVMVRGFRSSVINLMPAVAAPYLQEALTYAYSDVEALLQADERTELDDLWGANYQVTANTRKPVKRQRGRAAAVTVRTRLNAILAVPLVTYSANFTTNHLSNADVTRTTAKNKGEARDPIPPHNTVFKESYLRGLLIADATTGGAGGAAKADGEQWLRFQSPNPSNGRLSLATRNGRGGMDADDTGLYFVAIKYELSTVAGSRRQKRIRAFHIETDDD